MYLANTVHFDAAFIDASISDKRTGESTCSVLLRTVNDLPQVVYLPRTASLNGVAVQASDAVVVLSALDEAAVSRAFEKVLGLESNVGTGAGLPASSWNKAGGSQWTSEEVQAFLTLSRSLTEVLDLTEVLNRVVTAARDLTNAEEGMILLPDGESEQLYLRAKVGIDTETARNFRVKTQDSLAGQVFKLGKPTLIGQSGPLKVKTEYFVNSLLYVPILLKGKAIGVLGVNNRHKEDIFDERHQDLLLNLAAYAAIAIENARVHGLSVKRTRELKSLVDAGEVLNQSLQLEGTLATVVEQAVRMLNVSDAFVLEIDRPAGIFRLIARRRHLMWRAGQEPLIHIPNIPELEAAINGRGLTVVSNESSPPTARWLEANGAKSALLVPIAGDTSLLGVVLSFSVHAADDNTMPSYENMMRIRNLVSDIVGELAKGRDRSVAQVYKLTDEINRVLGTDWTEFAFQADDQTLAVQLSVGTTVRIGQDEPGIEITMLPELLNALDMQVAINTYRSDPYLSDGVKILLDFSGNNMVMGLPLAQRGHVTGMVVCGDSEHDHFFSPREIDLARALMAQSTTALENARLYRDLQLNMRELQTAQARLIQAERLSAMGELAAAVAHQINNPLTAILSDSQLLLEQKRQDTIDYEALSAIVRASQRAKGVVRRLLAAVRTNIDAGVEAVDIITTIEDTLALVRQHLERDGTKIYVKFPSSSIPDVQAVPGELEDVWLNILLNAHDVLIAREDGEVRIEVRYLRTEQMVAVEIADNGPGIPDSVINEIFKPFFTTKPLGEGTGLGLHIARQAVERAGGTIKVRSDSQTGTRFVVLLPALG
ncbi:MAG: GAF domain-containing protein [Anaerolineae bacterium]|nr:GAF domain-containing protein [Anaerolineae bacterium]